MESGARFTPALRAFFSRRAHQDDVEDLVQEVLLRIQKRQPAPVVNNVEGYLFEVAANVLIDRGTPRPLAPPVGSLRISGNSSPR